MAVASLDRSLAQALAYWRTILKYKWLVLIGTLALTTVLALIIGQLPSIYEATTTILVDPQQIPEKYVSSAVSSGNSDAYARLNTISQQVLSRTRLQEIIDKLDLYPEDRNTMSPEELVVEMRRDITIQAKQGTGPELSTFTLTYQGKHPAAVAQVANDLATSFIQWNIDSREGQVSGTKEFLSSELQAAKRNLEQQETRLRDFKMSHLGETPDQSANNLAALGSLRSGALQANEDAMNRLETERILLTRSAEPVAPPVKPADVYTTERERLQSARVQIETTIQQLREHYSDRYPDVVRATRRLQEINAQLNALSPDPVVAGSDPATRESPNAARLQLIDLEMQRLKTEQDKIQSQITSYQAKLDLSPLREQQLVELNRNYDISKEHYQALLDKSFTIGMAADLEQRQKAERFTVLDYAQVPVKPIKPRRKLLIALSGIAAFGISILCVLAKEELSPAIKTETELRSLLPAGVKVMGLIPRIELPSGVRRGRRLVVSSSFVCILLCLVLIGVLWEMRPNL